MVSPDTNERLSAALSEGGFDLDPHPVDGLGELLARQSIFRWRWLATRVHFFVFARRFESAAANRDGLDNYLTAACRYAIENKGGLPRGFQTGTAAITIAIVDNAPEEARRWASRSHGRRWGALTWPVLIDPAQHSIVHPRRLLLGGIYGGYLKRLSRDYLSKAVQK